MQPSLTLGEAKRVGEVHFSFLFKKEEQRGSPNGMHDQLLQPSQPITEYGEVLHCDWMHEAYDKATRQVLVIFDTAAAAEEVYNSLHDEVLDGMRISVEPV